MRRLMIWLGFLGVLAAGSSARAGGCPTCTGPAQCSGGFCVHHNAADIGCGSIVQTCCPGQACRIDTNGRPSCENLATCTVVGGNPAVDGGATVVDAALPTGDGSATTVDGGGKDGAASGCSCRTGAGGEAHGAPFALLGLAGLGWLVRRRRA